MPRQPGSRRPASSIFFFRSEPGHHVGESASTLFTRDTTALRHQLDVRPRNAVIVLDTPDGVDRRRRRRRSRERCAGLLAPAVVDAIATINGRSRGESRLPGGSAAQNVDDSHANCTLDDARPTRFAFT